APIDGVDGLKSLFSPAVCTKANAPNKSGRLLGTTISAFSHSLFGWLFLFPAQYPVQRLPNGCLQVCW
ncbi:hypothetical protein, partial [Pseudomonas silesiensis]|uniref:hypothetical protein n=1 Tax=Pseudomonas silesiensis TaxID=1853130 RepID=UPI0030DB6358